MPMTVLRFAMLALALVAAAPAARAITITEVTSAGGITAWLVEDHSLPVVTIDFDFRGGAALLLFVIERLALGMPSEPERVIVPFD